jgi:hypothetical protein
VDDEGEPPPPQDKVRSAMNPAAATTPPGDDLRQPSIERPFLSVADTNDLDPQL